jgi:hypothetical protein
MRGIAEGRNVTGILSFGKNRQEFKAAGRKNHPLMSDRASEMQKPSVPRGRLLTYG